jgi:hypothetical protein
MRPQRLPFAAGDGLSRYAPGSPVALRIDSPWEKPWKARLPGGATAASFPGTTILFEEALYEVVGAEEAGGRFLYSLRPWEEASPPRQILPYSVEACGAAAREREEHLRRLRQGHALSWLSPFVGLLSGEDQRRIERDYGVSASRATLISSLVLLGPSVLAVVRGLATLMADRAGLAHEVPWDTLMPLSSYLMAESLARLGAAGYAGEPLGSLFVAFPILAFRAVAEALQGREGKPPHPAGGADLRQELLDRRRTWVETFAPFWGLLDAATQRRLAELYGFDAPRHTAWSALGVGLFATFDGFLAFHYLGSRQGGPADLLMLLAAACLVWESLVRLRRSRSGEPAGSVLGWMLKPLARRLLV